LQALVADILHVLSLRPFQKILPHELLTLDGPVTKRTKFLNQPNLFG